jgi:predicted O-methyltransferase YrrM
MKLFDLDSLVGLYRTYEEDLRLAREAQRELLTQYPLKPKLDDLEAEITYLVLRDARPETVVEIGSFHGWSTTWILRALQDNGWGHLHTYDLVEHAARNVPDELAEGRWTFVKGDVRNCDLPPQIEHLFIDAEHSAAVARWYTQSLLPRLRPGTPVSVHDVYHGRRPWPMSEGTVLLDWLKQHEVDYLTPSPHGDADTHERLTDLKRKLRLLAPVHTGRDNPMVFFESP